MTIVSYNTDGDDGTSHVSIDGVFLNTTIASTNDIPTGDDVDFASNVAEDDSDPSGESVNSLFSSVFLDPIDAATDQLADEFKGIAIATNDSTSTQGVWEYKPNGGSWDTLPNVTASLALFLDKDAMLRFVPTGEYNGTVGSLHAYVIDDNGASTFSTSSEDVITNASSNGTQNDISTATYTIGIQVTQVNDAPTFTGNATITGTHNEDLPSSGVTIETIIGSLFEDATDEKLDSTSNPLGSQADLFAGVIVTDDDAESTEGVWEYKPDGGSTWIELGAVDPTAGVLLSKDTELRFNPATDFNGTPGALTVYAVEDSVSESYSTDSSRTTKTVAGSGGTSHIAADGDTISITITEINDAPVFASGVSLTDIAEDTTTNDGDLVFDLLDGPFNDNKDAKTTFSGGSTEDVFAGLAIVGDASVSSTQGVWQFKDSTSSTWAEVGTVSDEEGLLIDTTTRLRFVPVTHYNGSPGVLTIHAVEDSTTDTFRHDKRKRNF